MKLLIRHVTRKRTLSATIFLFYSIMLPILSQMRYIVRVAVCTIIVDITFCYNTGT